MRSLNHVLIFVSVVAVGGCVTSAGSTTEALTGATVTTDAPQYLLEQPIVISWTGLPGNAKDWVAYAPAGSTDTTVTRWVYTGGAVSGTAALEGAATAGMYVARAFVNDSYVRLAESQPVAVMGSGPPGARTRMLSGLAAVPEWPDQPGGPGATRVSNTWTFANEHWMYIPVPTNVGETLAGYQVYAFKGSSNAYAILTDLIEVDSATGQQSIVVGANNQDSAPGAIQVGAQGASRTVAAAKTYLIRIADGSGAGASSADSFTDALVTVL